MRGLSQTVAGVVAFTFPLAAQDWARQQVDQSSRHQEWVQVKNGDRTVHAFIVYPEVKDKAAAVVVIHEIMGLTDWVRSVTDDLAAQGYIAIAPDLLSGMGPNGGKTDAYPDVSAVREAISKLPPDQVIGDLNAVANYVKKLPAASGKLAIAGFCWGGSQTWRFANVRDDLAAAFPFYGAGPADAQAASGIRASVYGFYGGNDARVNASIPKTGEIMKAAGKKYEPVVYEGAGHGFMRSGQQPGAGTANKKARAEAWQRWLGLLRRM